MNRRKIVKIKKKIKKRIKTKNYEKLKQNIINEMKHDIITSLFKDDNFHEKFIKIILNEKSKLKIAYEKNFGKITKAQERKINKIIIKETIDLFKYILKKINKGLNINRKIYQDTLEMVNDLYHTFKKYGYKVSKNKLMQEAKGFFSNPLYPLLIYLETYMSALLNNEHKKNDFIVLEFQEKLTKIRQIILDFYNKKPIEKIIENLDYYGISYSKSKKKIFGADFTSFFQLTLLHELIHYILYKNKKQKYNDEFLTESIALRIFLKHHPELGKKYIESIIKSTEDITTRNIKEHHYDYFLAAKRILNEEKQKQLDSGMKYDLTKNIK